MVAVAGGSAAGKTAVASGLVQALGRDRCVSVSSDDYRRFDRIDRYSKALRRFIRAAAIHRFWSSIFSCWRPLAITQMVLLFHLLHAA